MAFAAKMKFISDLLQIYREASSIRRFFKIIKNNREVVFYSEDKGSYTCFEGLIDYLTNEAEKDVYYVTSEKSDPLFNLNNKRVHPFCKKAPTFFHQLMRFQGADHDYA